MTTPATEIATRSRISITARLLSALPYVLAAAGAASGALIVKGVLEGMKNAESAGRQAVLHGIAGANLAVLVALYLAVACGLASLILGIIRLFMTTKTASPPGLFYVVAGVLGLVPGALVWTAETLLFDALTPVKGNVSFVAPTISLLLTLSMITAFVFVICLLAASVWPISSRSKPRYGSVVLLLLVVMVLIGVTAAFQVRTLRLHELAVEGRL